MRCSVYALTVSYAFLARRTATGCAVLGHTGLLGKLQEHSSIAAQAQWHCLHAHSPSPRVAASSRFSSSSTYCSSSSNSSSSNTTTTSSSSSSSSSNSNNSSSSSVDGDLETGSQAEASPPKTTNTGPRNSAATDSTSLASILQELNVSYRANTYVVEFNEKQPLRADLLVSNIKQLQQRFGAGIVNKMLEAAPGMCVRSVDTLLQHYEGLKDVLGGKEDLALAMISKAPDLLNHAPKSIRTRLAALQDTFQVGQSRVLELARKAPTLLRSQPTRVAGLVGYLQQVSGMSAQQVLQVLLTWPMLATTSLELLQQRHQAVQLLLKASPAEMRAICKVSPNLLVRDPGYLANNIAELAQMLQLTQDALLPMLRKQPTLLYRNVSDLRTRMTVLCQTLRLPPESLVSLLVHNNTLMIHYDDIAPRVDYLKKALGLPESELLSLLQDRLSVLRLPTELMDSKLACARSLALLNPRWMADFQAMSPQLKLGILQLGPARFFRMAYLMHTGQQECGTFGQYLRASHPTFDRLFPGYADWLDRYSQIVGHQDIPLVPSFTPQGSNSPASYPVIRPRSLLGTGRTRTRTAAAVGDECVDLVQPDAVVGTEPSNPNRSSRSASGSTSKHNSRNFRTSISSCSYPPAEAFSSSTPTGHPPTPSVALAAWWGVEESRVRDLLRGLTGLKQRFSWHQWQQRLGALQDLMAGLGWVPAHPSPHAMTTMQSPQAVQRLEAGSTSSGRDAGSGHGNTSSGLSDSSRSAASIACSSGSGTALAHELPQSCQADSSRTPRMQVVAALSASHQGHSKQPRQQRSRRLTKTQPQPKVQSKPQSELQLDPHQMLATAASLDNLSPAACEALQYAMASGHAAAVACVSVACHLAPFSLQLYPPPPAPPPLVVQFALEHPQVVSRMAFVANCNMLAALVAERQYLRDWLQQGDPKLLSKCLDKHPTRLKMVQYLVQTQQHTPWAFTCEQLLVHGVLGPQGKGKGGRAAFVAAYPGYAAWEQAMHSL